MMISMIAAMAANRTIGLNNRIRWKIPVEQKQFRALTWGKPVIVGHRGHTSPLGGPPGRLNIIVTENKGYRSPDCLIVDSLNSALELCSGHEEVFIGSSERLYQLAIPVVFIIYLTEIHKEFDGDTFFPGLSMNESILRHSQYNDGNIPYAFRIDVRGGSIIRQADMK